jgi:PIN domain nuclease of toxin-antitoxin system
MGISYLIDTHILLWWLFDDPKLNAQCRDIIRNPDFNIIVSTVSAWEIATKYRKGGELVVGKLWELLRAK